MPSMEKSKGLLNALSWHCKVSLSGISTATFCRKCSLTSTPREFNNVGSIELDHDAEGTACLISLGNYTSGCRAMMVQLST